MPLDLQHARPNALICAVMGRDHAILAQARRRLEALWAPVCRESPAYAFDFTDYYADEMGPDLIKRLLWFEGLVDPAVLPERKRQAMEVEKGLAEVCGGRTKRRANIDPGLVTLESLVLASTKHSGHRICIAPGLYAEVTLFYGQGRYGPLEWTYPDYRTDGVQGFLQEIRTDLLAQRRCP